MATSRRLSVCYDVDHYTDDMLNATKTYIDETASPKTYSYAYSYSHGQSYVNPGDWDEASRTEYYNNGSTFVLEDSTSFSTLGGSTSYTAVCKVVFPQCHFTTNYFPGILRAANSYKYKYAYCTRAGAAKLCEWITAVCSKDIDVYVCSDADSAPSSYTYKITTPQAVFYIDYSEILAEKCPGESDGVLWVSDSNVAVSTGTSVYKMAYSLGQMIYNYSNVVISADAGLICALLKNYALTGTVYTESIETTDYDDPTDLPTGWTGTVTPPYDETLADYSEEELRIFYSGYTYNPMGNWNRFTYTGEHSTYTISVPLTINLENYGYGTVTAKFDSITYEVDDLESNTCSGYTTPLGETGLALNEGGVEVKKTLDSTWGLYKFDTDLTQDCDVTIQYDNTDLRDLVHSMTDCEDLSMAVVEITDDEDLDALLSIFTYMSRVSTLSLDTDDGTCYNGQGYYWVNYPYACSHASLDEDAPYLESQDYIVDNCLVVYNRESNHEYLENKESDKEGAGNITSTSTTEWKLGDIIAGIVIVIILILLFKVALGSSSNSGKDKSKSSTQDKAVSEKKNEQDGKSTTNSSNQEGEDGEFNFNFDFNFDNSGSGEYDEWHPNWDDPTASLPDLPE